MKIPSTLKVGAHCFDVEKVTYKEIEEAGNYDPQYHRIQINVEAGLKTSHDETFLHEIIEAVNDIAEMNLEHKIINDLSQWLFTIMRDNKLNFGK